MQIVIHRIDRGSCGGRRKLVHWRYVTEKKLWIPNLVDQLVDAVQAFLLQLHDRGEPIVEDAEPSSENHLWWLLRASADAPGEADPWREIRFVTEIVLRLETQSVAQRQVLANLPIILREYPHIDHIYRLCGYPHGLRIVAGTAPQRLDFGNRETVGKSLLSDLVRLNRGNFTTVCRGHNTTRLEARSERKRSIEIRCHGVCIIRNPQTPADFPCMLAVVHVGDVLQLVAVLHVGIVEAAATVTVESPLHIHVYTGIYRACLRQRSHVLKPGFIHYMRVHNLRVAQLYGVLRIVIIHCHLRQAESSNVIVLLSATKKLVARRQRIVRC